MSCEVDLTVVAANEEIGYINIEEIVEEIRRIEKILDNSDEASETSLINRNAGKMPVKVSAELFKLIERAKQISEITDGAFDISYAALDGLWRFDGSMDHLPTDAEIKRKTSKVGHKKIILDTAENTVFLKEEGMKISFDGIGKGYAADKAKELMVSKEVKAGAINACGSLTTWGTRATGEKWLLGIANPLGSENAFSWLPIVESSAATSGNREGFVVFRDKRYSGSIDPRTGYPSPGIKSVSVFAKSAELCDALATAVHVLGKDMGLALVNQLGGTGAVIVTNDDKVYKSFGILFERNP